MTIKFKLLAPMIYADEMLRYFKVKDIKKLPEIQRTCLEWLRTQVRQDTEFKILGQGHDKQTNVWFYTISPGEQSLNLQFPKGMFDLFCDECGCELYPDDGFSSKDFKKNYCTECTRAMPQERIREEIET